MTRRILRQRALEREVAQRTGEDRRTIRHRGFSVIDLREQDFDPEPDIRAPLMLDWDGLPAVYGQEAESGLYPISA